VIKPETKILDLGTGSGILAIAAAKLGAHSITAMDTDPTAVKTARENVGNNGVKDTINVIEGSLVDITQNYDLIVVNILAKVIVEMLQAGLVDYVRSRGKIIAAGIMADQEKDVTEALEQNGLTIVGRRQRGDWICLIAGLD
jgi:ribosomal protein L11 methyltransferase